MLDAGLILYIGLIVLFLWRFLSGWRLCGKWLEYANYCVLLYSLLLFLLVYACVEFVRACLLTSGKAAWDTLPLWMKPMMLGAPAASLLVFGLCALQSAQHVNEIRRGAATLRHDRAVQILALPALYSVMAMNSMARMYGLFAGAYGTGRHAQDMSAEERQQYFHAKSETCFWVGDLYEAWALFQFGKLTLDLIKDSMTRLSSSPVQERRESALALLTAYSAVESIAWLGVTLFLVVCLIQAGWACYLLAFASSPLQNWEDYNSRMSQFSAAGMVASAGAIYNVHIVESTFHTYFEGYRPLLKFITVKIIVSFAFFQKGCFHALQGIDGTLPEVMRNISKRVPLLGDILNFSEAQFDLFYASLMIYECVLIALLHWWAWSAYEAWYIDGDGKEADGTIRASSEKTPLLAPA